MVLMYQVLCLTVETQSTVVLVYELWQVPLGVLFRSQRHTRSVVYEPIVCCVNEIAIRLDIGSLGALCQ